MSTITKIFSILFTTLTVLSFQPVHAQDKLSWLDDYTGDMQIGSETYRYNFTNIEGNDCKLKFEELVTDKKGSTETHSWIFYLSDIDPSAISFKAKGKSITISMETHQSQKFISYYEEGEIDEYTEEIKITMNEVDMTRSFIETIKENITNCKETQVAWENRDQAFAWLVNNIEKATDEEIEWDQKFELGSRIYLVDFQANSVNEKGEQELFSYILDLSDINPLAINLKISGKSFFIEVPVKEGKRFIKVKSPTGTEFTNKLLIYANDIELARQIVNALIYVVKNTTPERPQWDSYSASLGFVKDNLGEVKIDDELFSNSINYEASPSGLVNLVIGKSDSNGTPESVKCSFYLTDVMDKVRLEVSKYSITIEIETKNKRDFIREMTDEKVTDYSSTLDFHVSDIDMARDILNAFEYAIRNSEEKIEEFSNISDVGSWFSENIGTIETDGDKYEQNLSIKKVNENQLIIEKKLTEADEGSTETSFILYPEDISLDELEIKVSGKKLTVPLETEKGKYIKKFENGKLQNFSGITEILFSDPLVAKNFIAAIRFLKANSVVEDRAAMNKDEAIAFLSGNIQNIDLPDEQYEQKLEVKDEGNCKMSFTRVETDDKGASDEYIYEFNIADIHPGSSELSVKGEIIEINLVTRGNEKLIKPYENGEAGNFVDDFAIYVDDVLLAKKTLAAFAALSEGCK
ncbi:MAG: hypothetical protein KAR19_18260 [Bacteroidales bacterium]|nr:hypothetical protein [Bacteroidales bacterium]